MIGGTVISVRAIADWLGLGSCLADNPGEIGVKQRWQCNEANNVEVAWWIGLHFMKTGSVTHRSVGEGCHTRGHFSGLFRFGFWRDQ